MKPNWVQIKQILYIARTEWASRPSKFRKKSISCPPLDELCAKMDLQVVYWKPSFEVEAPWYTLTDGVTGRSVAIGNTIEDLRVKWNETKEKFGDTIEEFINAKRLDVVMNKEPGLSPRYKLEE